VVIVVVSIIAPTSLEAVLVTIATIAQGVWVVYPTIATQVRDR